MNNQTTPGRKFAPEAPLFKNCTLDQIITKLPLDLWEDLQVFTFRLIAKRHIEGVSVYECIDQVMSVVEFEIFRASGLRFIHLSDSSVPKEALERVCSLLEEFIYDFFTNLPDIIRRDSQVVGTTMTDTELNQMYALIFREYVTIAAANEIVAKVETKVQVKENVEGSNKPTSTNKPTSSDSLEETLNRFAGMPLYLGRVHEA